MYFGMTTAKNAGPAIALSASLLAGCGATTAAPVPGGALPTSLVAQTAATCTAPAAKLPGKYVFFLGVGAFLSGKFVAPAVPYTQSLLQKLALTAPDVARLRSPMTSQTYYYGRYTVLGQTGCAILIDEGGGAGITMGAPNVQAPAKATETKAGILQEVLNWSAKGGGGTGTLTLYGSTNKVFAKGTITIVGSKALALPAGL